MRKVPLLSLHLPTSTSKKEMNRCRNGGLECISNFSKVNRYKSVRMVAVSVAAEAGLQTTCWTLRAIITDNVF